MNAQELQEIRDRADAAEYLGGLTIFPKAYEMPEGYAICAVIGTAGSFDAAMGTAITFANAIKEAAHAPADVRNLLVEVERITAELDTAAAANARLAAERDDTSAELADMRVRYENIASSKEYTA